MRRTNIYLAEDQLAALRSLGERRFAALLARRRRASAGTSAEVVERDVIRAVAEVRRARAASGR